MSYSLRVNLSVAVVAMIDTSKHHHEISIESCPRDNASAHHGEIQWDDKTKGIVLSSFFYGYIVTQMPGGWLANRFGPKVIFGLGIFCTAFFTLFTPVAAKAHYMYVVILRVVEGLGEGVTYPAMHMLWSKWAPPLQRSQLVSFSHAGANLGTVFTLPLAGLLCDSVLGWESVFYIFGGIGCTWFICWMLFTSDSPRKHKRIDVKERDYIEKSINASRTDLSLGAMRTPWLRMFTSPQVWAITMGHVGFTWGLYTLITYLPSYMSDMLGFNLKANGLLSAIPYLCCWIVAVSGGVMADWLQTRGLTVEIVRKLFQTLGCVTPGLCLMAVGWVKCDRTASIILLCIGFGFTGLCVSGYNCNHFDIAPRFAGVLIGITNTAATISGILSPYCVGALVKKPPTFKEWQLVFYIAAAIYGFTSFIFCVFASGEIQPWAKRVKTIDPEDDEFTNPKLGKLH